jgi:hypothetical protein
MLAWGFQRVRPFFCDLGLSVPMRTRTAGIVVALAATFGACTSTGVPVLPAGSGQIETTSTQTLPTPVETATTVPGGPTDVYALVARGIHACWFGAGGPLRGTHVFHAEAQPPSQGGRAEIVIHESDVALRDLRGPQAFRVSFASAIGGTLVGVAAIKVPPGFGEPMTRDVEVWVKGGSGCQLRAAFPQPAATPAQKQPGKPSAKGKR